MQAMRPMSRQEVRAFDQRAIEQLGVPGVILMENAGRQAADVAAHMLQESGGCRALVIAGPGNNGGDGFVIARHLLTWGYEVEVLLMADAERVKGDALINYRPLKALGIAVIELGDVPAEELRQRILESAAESDLLIDAMLGTGLTDEVREPFATAIEALNEAARPVLAIDVPSGLDADTGRPLGRAVRATATVTMVAPKMGFEEEAAAEYLGEVYVADIGVPVDEV